MEATKATSPMRVNHGRLIAEVSLPGFKKEEIKVEPLYDGIQISAFRERTDSDKPWPNQQSIRSYWRFFNLPAAAHREGLKYKFRRGKLTISMPYDEEEAEDNEQDKRTQRPTYERNDFGDGESGWGSEHWPGYRHGR